MHTSITKLADLFLLYSYHSDQFSFSFRLWLSGIAQLYRTHQISNFRDNYLILIIEFQIYLPIPGCSEYSGIFIIFLMVYFNLISRNKITMCFKCYSIINIYLLISLIENDIKLLYCLPLLPFLLLKYSDRL